MKMTVARSALALLLVGVAASYSGATLAREPEVRNHEAPGNLESKYDLGCVDAGGLQNRYTPVDLYNAAGECAEAGRYADGVLLFAMAGAYGRFDTLRVADKSAHQAVIVARMQALSPLAKGKQAAFGDSLNQTLRSPESLAAVCGRITRVGSPDYYPRYMVQHGMGAFLGSGSGDGLVEDFDAGTAWKQVLETYLHCSNIGPARRPGG